MFIDKLLYHKANIKLFLENNGIKMMVDMLTLAHLHTSRAYVPTQVRSAAGQRCGTWRLVEDVGS